jgi:2-hydroxy-3-keto-5-methylthiopentenyl-1-phosphate phosphatase
MPPEASPEGWIVLDFDGTITVTDTLDLVVRRFGDPSVRAEAEDQLGKRLSLADVLALNWATVRAEFAEVASYLRTEVEFRLGLTTLVDAAEHHGWRVRVVSSGATPLIHELLTREGLERLEVLANDVEPDPDGWRLVARRSTRCDVCGEACKRDALPQGFVVFVGDGYSDLCSARVAQKVFARRRLADMLDRFGIPYEPFSDFHQIVDSLATERLLSVGDETPSRS